MKSLILVLAVLLLAGCGKSKPHPVISIHIGQNPDAGLEDIVYRYFGQNSIEVTFKTGGRIPQTFVFDVQIDKADKDLLDKQLSSLHLERYEPQYVSDLVFGGDWVNYRFYDKGKNSKTISAYYVKVIPLYQIHQIVELSIPQRFWSNILSKIEEATSPDRHGPNYPHKLRIDPEHDPSSQLHHAP